MCNSIPLAAEAIRGADALLIGAGAGMGVDSGLPDFRGDEGFWRAYPPFRGRRFAEMSNPRWFHHDPEQAWGFFGHRLNLYRSTPPHRGFEIVRRWAESKPGGYFVFTSNVDGHFQRAGFDPQQIVECHGTICSLQCVDCCSGDIWSSAEIEVTVDGETVRAAPPLPMCRHCAGLARPNILMFGDYQWLDSHTAEQEERFRTWLGQMNNRNLVTIEFGAGTAVPTVRWQCQKAGRLLIRVNPRESDTPPGGISLPLRALEAIEKIDQLLAGG